MFSLRYSVAQSAEMCLPNLVGFVERNARMIFFTPLMCMRLSSGRTWKDGKRIVLTSRWNFGSIGGAKADPNQAEDLSTAGFLASSGPAI